MSIRQKGIKKKTNFKDNRVTRRTLFRSQWRKNDKNVPFYIYVTVIVERMESVLLHAPEESNLKNSIPPFDSSCRYNLKYTFLWWYDKYALFRMFIFMRRVKGRTTMYI